MSKGYKASSRSEPEFQADCPTPEQVLEQLLKKWKGGKPKMMPSDPFQAARWWIAHQLPANDWQEAAEKVWDGPKFCGWSTPYHDRLRRCLLIFLRLKSYEQAYIVEAIERGIPWKGDPMWIFKEVVNESDKMLADPIAYKAKHNLTVEEIASEPHH